MITRHRWYSDGSCEWCKWERYRIVEILGQRGPFRYQNRTTREVVKRLPVCIERQPTRY